VQHRTRIKFERKLCPIFDIYSFYLYYESIKMEGAFTDESQRTA
jgi:hypothetical protein